jgi:hypothetical protein
MNINYYIDKKFPGNSKEVKERIEIALATICINAKKHLDYTNGVERFFKNLEV